MAVLVIENVEDDLHLQIQAQARANSRSTEEEVHLLLQRAVAAPPDVQPGDPTLDSKSYAGLHWDPLT